MSAAFEFAITLRLLFGQRAKRAANFGDHPTKRAEWIGRALREFGRDVLALDTTIRHKQMLLGELEAAADAVSSKEHPSWELVYRLLRLVMRLLGYDFHAGAKCHSLAYWQTVPQNLNTTVFTGGDVMQDYYDQKNALAIRAQVVDGLKAQGLSDYRIALVLNVTDVSGQATSRSVTNGTRTGREFSITRNL